MVLLKSCGKGAETPKTDAKTCGKVGPVNSTIKLISFLFLSSRWGLHDYNPTLVNRSSNKLHGYIASYYIQKKLYIQGMWTSCRWVKSFFPPDLDIRGKHVASHGLKCRTLELLKSVDENGVGFWEPPDVLIVEVKMCVAGLLEWIPNVLHMKCYRAGYKDEVLSVVTAKRKLALLNKNWCLHHQKFTPLPES